MENKMKEAIDSFLAEKSNQIANQVSSSEDVIFAELEKIKKMSGDLDFQPPGGWTKESGDHRSIRIIHQYTLSVSQSMNQMKLISTMLEAVGHFCSRAAFFLLRDDKLVGWRGKGFDESDSEMTDKGIKSMFVSLSADTTFKAVLQKKEVFRGGPRDHKDNHLIFNRFGDSLPGEIVVFPFLVKGKPQAVFYVDRMGKRETFGLQEIEILIQMGEMSLDLLPLKQKMKARVKTQKFLEDDGGDEAEEPRPRPDEAGITKETPRGEETDLNPQQEKARRYARVTISDIVLYNKEKVEQARENRNIFEVLEDTIMQAKEAYLMKHNDLLFFEKELLDSLALGDKEALKGYRFEKI